MKTTLKNIRNVRIKYLEAFENKTGRQPLTYGQHLLAEMLSLNSKLSHLQTNAL